MRLEDLRPAPGSTKNRKRLWFSSGAFSLLPKTNSFHIAK